MLLSVANRAGLLLHKTPLTSSLAGGPGSLVMFAAIRRANRSCGYLLHATDPDISYDSKYVLGTSQYPFRCRMLCGYRAFHDV